MMTWGKLRTGDTITDSYGNDWEVKAGAVLHATRPVRATVEITNGPRSYTITKDATAPVQGVHTDSVSASLAAKSEKLQERVQLVADRLGPVDVLAEETTAERNVREGPDPRFPLAVSMTDPQLRSHLYLVHGYALVANLTNRMSMLEHHRKCHETTPDNHEETV